MRLTWDFAVYDPFSETNLVVSSKHYYAWRKSKNKKFWEELIAFFPWYDTERAENDASNNSFIVEFVFVAAVTFLLSRCLKTIGGF
jgi:hypothetical protein